ncbi:hypothetical protein [Pseudoalteromonas sp. BDTF-M6]|uniref:hypothetical protein n=1 Tax=Pseudoalteromonas sp. BDTF-M6 TaxID=2796132 RepID=UPI001BAF32CD|nr:hypothetical protein [Pseudoalteromonas sp. BDTF-M6]MBS3798381.1 hypothetical protein [Pseudoalteromonas sp. BDTF-M6]
MGKLIAAFINWGFMMALLFNLVSYSESVKRANSPLWISAIINISYLSTSFMERSTFQYLPWALADFITIGVMYWVQRSRNRIVALYYCAFGLSINGLLHLLLYIDLNIRGNYDPWWLWSLYSVGINLNDALMIIVLVVNRDFLGLCRLGGWLKACVRRDNNLNKGLD